MGVLRVEVQPHLPLAGKPLSGLWLKTRKVQVLSIRRRRKTITAPRRQDVVLPGDEIICYESEEAAWELLSVRDEQAPRGPAAEAAK